MEIELHSFKQWLEISRKIIAQKEHKTESLAEKFMLKLRVSIGGLLLFTFNEFSITYSYPSRMKIAIMRTFLASHCVQQRSPQSPVCQQRYACLASSSNRLQHLPPQITAQQKRRLYIYEMDWKYSTETHNIVNSFKNLITQVLSLYTYCT